MDSDNFIRSIIESLTVHIVIIDHEGIIQYVNPAWVRFGRENGDTSTGEWRGISYLDACDAAAKNGEAEAWHAAAGIREVIGGKRADFYFEYPCHSPAVKRWFMMRVDRLEWNGPEQFIISHQSITERKLAEEKLNNLTLLDGLTGISNRRHFDFFLDNEWRRAMRIQKPLSLVIFDIDYFKAFNDNYGHLEGDECLKSVGMHLSDFGKRPGDLVARYGGEEFAVILADTDIEPATAIAEKIRVAIHDLNIRHEYSDVADVVTASVGIAALCPEKGSSEKILILAADKALYESKRSGRNRVSVGQ